MSQYCPLHLHTSYSFLDGHGRVENYVKRAAELGIKAMATTDHGNVCSWLGFHEAATDNGVKPILGCEMYQARKTRFDRDEEERAGRASDELEQRGPYHLTVLARNEVGYRNLIKLSSQSWLTGFYVKPRIDHELIAEHAEGLIILSGCLNGEMQQALMRGDYEYALAAAARFQDMVGKENFYIEVMDHGLMEQVNVKEETLKIAAALGAPIVATNDSHYVHKEESGSHDIMLCVATNATMDQENRFKFCGPHFYLKSYEEMAELFPQQWLMNTERVAESVDLNLSFGELHFPEYPLPEGADVDGVLEKDVWAGITRRYGDSLSQEVIERTQHELDVVKRMGFQSYFLVVADIVNWARNNGVRVGPGRGSAAGAIMSYALGITGLDPMRFELMFERFLVEGRKSMPDIDLDFDDRSRELVVNYIKEKYGKERVANIATFHQVGARQSIRDAARVLGADYKTGDKIAKLVPPPALGVSKSLGDALQTPDLARMYRENQEAREIIDAARGLEGLNRQTGIHAAGVVISKTPTTDYVPVMQRGEDEPIVTQWAMDDVERCGQLKVDCLGLRNIGVIDLCLHMLGERAPDIELIPYDDAATYKMLCDGYSSGVFQLESEGMREVMLGLQPDCIEDLMALVSLFRPGPLGSGMDKNYIRRKHGREAVVYDHPLMEPIAKETYGILLYQEQILAVARDLAGFNMGEADDLRKAVGKKQMEKIPLFRAAFVEGCRANKVDAGTANKIYSDIEYFGGYGFGRAHAASYALIAYWTAYLKCHYSAEYMAALLTSVAAHKDRMVPYLRECKRLHIRVWPPHLDLSDSEFKIMSENEILFGLSSIEGMGPAVVGKLLAMREPPITTLYEFFRRCPPEVLDSGTINRLVASGAIDHLAPEGWQLTRTEKASVLEVEKKYLRAYVTEHPLAACWIFLEPQISATIEQLESLPSGQRITVAGVMSEVKVKKNKAGASYYVFELEDLTGRLEVLVFPKDAEHLNPVEGEIVLIDGRLQRDGDEERSFTKLFFEGIRRPELPDDVGGAPIRLLLKEAPASAVLARIDDIIAGNVGDSPLYMEYPHEEGHQVVLRYLKTTSADAEVELRRAVSDQPG